LARFDIVPDRSQVWIDATSNVHPIHTHTDGLEGFLEVAIDNGREVDLDVAPQGQLSLPVSRLSSGSVLEDRELQRRIDARRFRTIDGRLSHIKATGRDGRYLVRGDITFRGVTNSYEEEMTVARLDEWTLQLDGRATFDIRDFGMEPPRVLMLKVDPEVEVRVAIVARREG
jgi:polyisoprenoid-binding protein YceI